MRKKSTAAANLQSMREQLVSLLPQRAVATIKKQNLNPSKTKTGKPRTVSEDKTPAANANKPFYHISLQSQ
jgi:hypothetical protein